MPCPVCLVTRWWKIRKLRGVELLLEKALHMVEESYYRFERELRQETRLNGGKVGPLAGPNVQIATLDCHALCVNEYEKVAKNGGDRGGFQPKEPKIRRVAPGSQ